MAEFPALPLFTDAFISDTIHLNAAQTGAYIMLLMAAWRSPDCRLPDDDRILSRMARMDGRAWAANKEVIMAFWKKDDLHKWYQRRLVDERKYVDDTRRKNAEAGRASALKRKDRHSTTVQPKRNQNPTPTPTPTPTPLPSSDSVIKLPPAAAVTRETKKAAAAGAFFNGENGSEILTSQKVGLSNDWVIPDDWGEEIERIGVFCRDEIILEGKKFFAYWKNADPRTLDNWLKHWRNWFNTAQESKNGIRRKKQR